LETELKIKIQSKNITHLDDEEMTKIMEEQIHNAITQWLKEQLNEYMINEVIFDNAIPNFDFVGVEEYDDLGDYGDIKITLEQNNEEEVLAHFTKKVNIYEEEPENIKIESEEDE